MSSQDTKEVLVALEKDEKQAQKEARTEAENLKGELTHIEAKLEKLLNLYLSDTLSTAEYAAKKNSLMPEKVRVDEKITDIKQKGVSWLEPAREFVLSLNQAANLTNENFFAKMTAFLKNIAANHVLRNREFRFERKIQYARATEHREVASSNFQFPFWCAR